MLFSYHLIILNDLALCWHKDKLIKCAPKFRGSFDISCKSDESCSEVSVCPSKGQECTGGQFPWTIRFSLPVPVTARSKV